MDTTKSTFDSFSFFIYIVHLDAYKLHPEAEKVVNAFIDKY